MVSDVEQYKRETDWEHRARVDQEKCFTCNKDKPFCTQCGNLFFGDNTPKFTDNACNQWTGFLLAFDSLKSKLGMEAKPEKWIDEILMLCPDSGLMLTFSPFTFASSQ